MVLYLFNQPPHCSFLNDSHVGKQGRLGGETAPNSDTISNNNRLTSAVLLRNLRERAEVRRIWNK